MGSECVVKIFHSFLKFWAYDEKSLDAGSAEYAKVEPHKVGSVPWKSSDPRVNIDVLKVEVPVNKASYVEGFKDGGSSSY